MTKDEETLVGRIDAIPGWLDDHPDLAEDAEKVAAGERLPKGRDHIKEAKERIGSLDTAVEHLSRVRRSRDAGAQVEIDAALERAREYRQRLVDIVGAVSYTHLRAHETVLDLVCRLLLEKKKHKTTT